MSDDDKDLLDELEGLGDAYESQPEAKAEAAEPVPEVQAPIPMKIPPGAIELNNPLQGEGDLNELLNFDDLDIALKTQAAQFAYFSQLAAHAMVQFNRAKQNLEQVEAEVSYKMRNNWDTDADGKLTEKALDAKVKMQSRVKNATECLNDAQYIHKICGSVVEAFHQREQMVIQTCKRAEIEIMTKGSYSGRFTNKEERDRAVKEALKNKSNSQAS